MKVLGIGAHPDDIEIFMYGLLSIFKKEGHQVSIQKELIMFIMILNKQEILFPTTAI